jgi:heptose-I-phosphate ethanolaminephosphotransferase
MSFFPEMNRSIYKILLVAWLVFLGAGGMYCYRYRATIKMLLPIDFPEISVDAKTYPSTIKFDEKIWLHRVNSIQRAKIIEKKYKGIEVDIVYDSPKNCFDVRHSSVASANLCLEGLLKNIKDPSLHYYWLDFKNLDSSNQISALTNLLDLSEKFKIKQNIILESTCPQLLTAFTDSGFYTSYYLPFFNPFNEEDEISYSNLTSQICENLKRSRVNAISGYYFQYPFVEKYFPNTDFLLWHIVEDDSDLFSDLLRERMAENNQIKVILVHEESAGYE